jgi:hypothetical protein
MLWSALSKGGGEAFYKSVKGAKSGLNGCVAQSNQVPEAGTIGSLLLAVNI